MKRRYHLYMYFGFIIISRRWRHNCTTLFTRNSSHLKGKIYFITTKRRVRSRHSNQALSATEMETLCVKCSYNVSLFSLTQFMKPLARPYGPHPEALTLCKTKIWESSLLQDVWASWISCLMNYCLWLYRKWLEWMTEIEYILQVLSIMVKHYVASSNKHWT